MDSVTGKLLILNEMLVPKGGLNHSFIPSVIPPFSNHLRRHSIALPGLEWTGMDWRFRSGGRGTAMVEVQLFQFLE